MTYKMENIKKQRYSRTLALAEPFPVHNADVYTMEVSAELVRSVRFWPLGTGLQIDFFSIPTGMLDEQWTIPQEDFDRVDETTTKNGKSSKNKKTPNGSTDAQLADVQIAITFTQLGPKFSQWQDEVVNIVGGMSNFVRWTNKEFKANMKILKPNDVYELEPYGEKVHFDATDFANYQKAKKRSIYDEQMMSASEQDEMHAHQFRTEKALPFARWIRTSDLMQVFFDTPGTFMRTIIAPISEEEADHAREEEFKINPHLRQHVDMNCSVVDCRCYIGAIDQVPVALKRLSTGMASDTELNELDKIEAKQIWKDPLKTVRGYHRLCPTAASFIRLPALDVHDTVKPKKIKAIDLEVMLEAQKQIYAEMEKDVLEKVDRVIEEKLSAAKILDALLNRNLFSDRENGDKTNSDSSRNDRKKLLTSERLGSNLSAPTFKSDPGLI